MTKSSPEFSIETKLYRDERGRLRKTRSSHYRFDLLVKRDNKPFAAVMGLRLDLAAARILPVTIPNGGGVYTVAEIAPGAHDYLADQLIAIIKKELEEESIASRGGY